MLTGCNSRIILGEGVGEPTFLTCPPALLEPRQAVGAVRPSLAEGSRERPGRGPLLGEGHGCPLCVLGPSPQVAP